MGEGGAEILLFIPKRRGKKQLKGTEKRGREEASPLLEEKKSGGPFIPASPGLKERNVFFFPSLY